MTGGPAYKQLRIFVSSTFNDMRNERSLLVGKVFPMVADYCHKKKMEFVGVDLRWGVSEEQSRLGQTVDICMAEIDRCRPLFMGMVGQRYGWVPDGSPVSVTEQEMLYGALDSPAEADAFFYLRDPALTEELCGPFEQDSRLDDLKARIRASGYPVLDGYRDLDSFGQRVYEDLTGLVDRIAADAPSDPVGEERENQIFLAERFASHYVERAEAASLLDRYAREGGLTLLTGEPGAGKTALLSHWALGRLKDGDAYTFVYYTGSSSDKGWESPGRQLVEELRRVFDIDYPLPEDKEQLRRAIYIVLNMAAKKGRVLLVLDQVDALPLDDGFGLSWLPEDLPEGVSAVLSLEAGDALDRLRLRAHRELCLTRLSPEEIGDVAERYLAGHSKTLSRRHLDMLRHSAAAGNPLYLITLLNEIRHIGRHDYLTEQLGSYLECGDIQELFEKVLDRVDRDFDEENDGLPRRLFSLLEASRGGLTEGELLPLLGGVPQARFAPLRLALDTFTSVSGGAFQIAVPEFRQAVRRHYALEEEVLEEVRGTLVAWFSEHPETPRRNYVLPWLLYRKEDFPALFTLLSEPACFIENWRRNRNETKEYWAALGGAGRGPADSCREALAAPEKRDCAYLLGMGELLAELGNVREAEMLLSYVAGDGSPADDHQRDTAFGVLGNLYQRQGRFSEAEKNYREKYRCAVKRGDRYEQQRAMGNIGLISLILGEPQAAREAFENVLSLAVSLNQRDAQQVALGNLGNLAFSLGDAAKAKTLYERQRDICLDSGNIAGLITACGALGILLTREKEYDAAEREFRTQEEQSRRIGSADGLANALGNRAALAGARGERDRAEELFREKLDLCRRTGQFLGEQNALGNLSSLAAQRGDLLSALDYAEQRTGLTLRNRAFRQYADALYRLSGAERALGRDEPARLHRLQAETVAKQHGFSALLRQMEKDDPQ